MTEHEICKVCGFPFDKGTHADCVFKLSQELDRLRVKWISVDAQLPQVKEDALFLCAIHGVSRDFVDTRTFWKDSRMFSGNGVTHWMPLPEPPCTNTRAEAIP